MEPVLSLFVLVFAAVVDLGTGKNTTVIEEDWIPQKPSVKYLTSLVNDGSESARETRSGYVSVEPPKESIIKYLLVTPTPVRDIRQVTETNQYESKLRSHSLLRNRSESEEEEEEEEEVAEERRYKSSSHLRLHKTDDNRIVIRENDSEDKSRATRNAAGFFDLEPRKRQRKRAKSHRMERFLYDSNLKSERLLAANRDSQSYKYYPDKPNDDAGDRYFYNDFGSDEHYQHSEEAWRALPESPFRGNQQNGQRRFQGDSCKKYLEFLKYAFEQLDTPSKRLYVDDQDEYFYYDDDYNKAEPKIFANSYVTKPPPVITPDMAILHRMAVTNYGHIPYEEEAPPPGGTERRSSELPDKSSTSVSPKTSSPLSFDVFGVRHETEEKTESTQEGENQNITESHSGSAGMATAESQSPKKQDNPMSEDCHDKLFPCPDNVNVTYPVNGYCNRFVACEAGKAHPEFCQDGLHFNLVEKQCDLPHNSFCTYSCPTADGYFAVPGDCGGFFRCSNWYPEYRLCPPRMHWDNKAKICTFEELSSCPLKCDAPYQVKPYNGVCNAYIVCTRGIPRYHQCPEGNHFDGKQLKCFSKLLSNCINDDDYIAKNRGIENGKKTLCADVEVKDGGKARWCQETFEEPKT